jgi:hypothetical protein
MANAIGDRGRYRCSGQLSERLRAEQAGFMLENVQLDLRERHGSIIAAPGTGRPGGACQARATSQLPGGELACH